ncbi:hypothetical protein SLS62_000546 [Diatrype stigma]|uniref:Aminoglycoside phosphotransferase domain-containing protein n=1 Tax=Diatrype stigma TaxID=117547 RepID=A0AAN9V1K5_9PEZI
MAPLEQSEKDEIAANILQQLASTPFACSSLLQLTNGTTNFVFRGTLIRPVPSPEGSGAVETVIVKHSSEFAAVNKDLPIHVSRCIAEESMLNALKEFHYDSHHAQVKVPHLYLFDRETSTQVLEDIPGVVDLKTIFVSPNANDVLSKPLATSIGRALGSWLRAFHAWASAPAQSHLCANAEMGTNELMRKLKYFITYGSFIEVLEKFPDVIGDHKKSLQEVQHMAIKEFEKTASGDGDGREEWGLIHGDFWTGNVLFPESRFREEKTKLFIVDWEFAQYGHRAYDIGQMIGDMYERKHFKGVEGAIWAIDGFIDGYGPPGLHGSERQTL